MTTARITLSIELQDDLGRALEPRKGFKVGNQAVPLPDDSEHARNVIEKALVGLLPHAYMQIEKRF